ncbi:MAG: zinc-binding dehydrogenase [Anaerolineae bacterium]|nr:zinc-binding dehydrogenase [Anaerolineae bacterium]
MKLETYKQGKIPTSTANRMWLLHGTGFESFGHNDAPETCEMPKFGPDEILVRHDAVGLCGADVKLIRLGQQHPRITADLSKEPVAVGHEVALTVVGVGANIQDRFKIGDRFIVQPDIYKGGVGYGYGFALHGGLSQYAVLDDRVLAGDAGCYLLPIQPAIGYAESAIIEALTAVVAAYRLKFRSTLKPEGVTWIIGSARAKEGYIIRKGFDEHSHPARLILSNVPQSFASWLRQRAKQLGIQVADLVGLDQRPTEPVDDLVILGADPELIENALPALAFNGVLTVMDTEPLPRKVKVGMGRVHYDRWVLGGTTSLDISEAYIHPLTRSNLKPAGRAWFVGSGGPIGRTHVQSALAASNGPKTILCTDLSEERIQVMRQSYTAEAKEKGVEFICMTPDDPAYDQKLQELARDGFDDIMVCAPSTDAIAEAFNLLAPQGVINIFAGVAKDALVEIDLSSAWLKGTRTIGFSGSTVEDMRKTLELIETGEFEPARLVMAVGSIEAAKEGLQAVMKSVYPGKIVIYNHIKNFPLTPIRQMKDRLPSVAAKLKNGIEWTREAEEEFLKLLLA